MPELFGTEGLINHITLLISAAFVLGAMLFRKNVANDIMGFPFSVIGSSAGSILLFIVFDNMFNSIKIPLATGLIGFFAGGFLLASIIGDGETE